MGGKEDSAVHYSDPERMLVLWIGRERARPNVAEAARSRPWVNEMLDSMESAHLAILLWKWVR